MKNAYITRVATIMVFLTGLLVTLAGKQSNVVAEEDQGIGRAVAEHLGKMFISSMKPSKGKVPSRYDSAPVPVNINKHEFETVLQSLRDNILFLTFHFRDTIKTEFDSFLIANGTFAKTEIEWEKVIGANSHNILREATAKEKDKDGMFNKKPGQVKLYLSDSKTKPLYAEGKMHITVPIRFAHVAFDSADVGKTRKSDPLTVTLLRCENDLVGLELKGLPDDVKPVLVARDDMGGRLKKDSAMITRIGDMTAMYKACGRIAKIEIFLPVEFADIALMVRANSEPDTFSRDDWQVKSSRYMPDPGMPKFVTMDLTELKARTRVVSQRDYAIIGFNTPEISVRLSRVDNSAFAHVKFGEPKLFDGEGKNVEYSLKGIPFDHETFSDEVRFTVKDKKEPIEFTHAVGTVSIRYPAKLKVLTFTPPNMKHGNVEVQFRGPKIMIRGVDDLPWRPFLPDRLTALHAYDGNGRRLRKLNTSGNVYENGRNWKLAGFWGEPKELKVVTIEKWIELDIPFDLPPAPKLPKSQRGTRPAEYE